jgi:hypothetical protein
MKKVWKWVIGVVVVLAVLAALVGGAFLLRSHFENRVSIALSNQPGVQVPGRDYGQRDGNERFPGMMAYGNYEWGGHGVYMRGPGMMGFGRMGLFGGLIGGLFWLGFLALIVLGIVWLVRRLRQPVAPVAAVATAAPVESTVPVAPVAETHACPKCGQPIQADWKHCPYCGKRF